MRRILLVIMVVMTAGLHAIAQQSEFDTTVYLAQMALLKGAHDPGKASGVSNPKTIEAIRQFQQASGLTITGILDNVTLAAMGIKEVSTFVVPIVVSPDGIETHSDVTVTAAAGKLLRFSGNIESVEVGGRFYDLTYNPGATHHLKGRIEFEGGGFEDYVFEGDTDDPLTFRLVAAVGYVYLGGKGTVSRKSSRTLTTFPIEKKPKE